MRKPLIARYWIESGEFSLGSIYTFKGYSGYGEGKNNAHSRYVRNVGPIPDGEWLMRVDDTDRNPHLGRPVIRLTPCAGTETKGRSGFLIHGDNSTGTASKGCIILRKDMRELIASAIAKAGGTGILHVFSRLGSPAP